jgi:prepilin-type N-terminal cleavage/methylation domain-containing protein
MNRRLRGLTLSELLVALAIVVIVGAVAVPVAVSLKEALRGTANTQTIVSTALQNARAIAMREGQYAGVRFQRDKDGNQYAVYIVHHPQDTYPEGAGAGSVSTVKMYKAVKGRSPIRLPEGMALIDMVVRDNLASPLSGDSTFSPLIEGDLDDSTTINVNGENVEYYYRLIDATTFSVIFDAKGNLVKVEARIRSRNADVISDDKIFNTTEKVQAGEAKFITDDYANLGLGSEYSRIQFKIFDTSKYKELGTAANQFEYLDSLPYVYVNQYTGKLMGGQ